MTDRARLCNMHCHRTSGGGPELVSVVSPGAYPLESLEFHPWYLQNEYNGDSHHKFEVLGLVTDEKHRDIHSDRSSYSREKKQCLLGCAKLNAVLF